MKTVCIFLALTHLIRLSGQTLQFQEQSMMIEVQEHRTTYLFVKGIRSASLDIGHSACFGEVVELQKGYWLIKLKATQVFDKTTLLLIGQAEVEIPIIEIRYSPRVALGKYVLDLTARQDVKRGDTVIQKRNTIVSPSESSPILPSLDKPKKADHVEITIDPLNISRADTPSRSPSNRGIFPAKYRLGETFIAGKVTAQFHLRIFNLLHEGDDLILAFELHNKQETAFQIDDYQLQIIKNYKNRMMSTEVKGTEISLRRIGSRQKESLFIRCPFFQLSEHETLFLTLKESTEYGMGREIRIEIPFGGFGKVREGGVSNK